MALSHRYRNVSRCLVLSGGEEGGHLSVCVYDDRCTDEQTVSQKSDVEHSRTNTVCPSMKEAVTTKGRWRFTGGS